MKRSPIVKPEPDPYENEPEAEPSKFFEDLNAFTDYIFKRYGRSKS